jgi:hypothetical protein
VRQTPDCQTQSLSACTERIVESLRPPLPRPKQCNTARERTQQDNAYRGEHDRMKSDEDDRIQLMTAMVELTDQAVQIVANPFDFALDGFCLALVADRLL